MNLNRATDFGIRPFVVVGRWMLLAFIPWVTIQAAEPSPSKTVSLDCGSFSFEFSPEGRPVSLRTIPDGPELLASNDPSPGFVLRYEDYDHRRTKDTILARLGKLQLKGSRLIAASADGKYAAAFDVKATGKYLAFRVAGLRGIPLDPAYSLHFEMRAQPAVRVFELDYMTSTRHRDGVQVDWYNLYKSGSKNPPGGFTLYVKSSDDDEDDTILRIWSDENLPHPKINGPWNLAAAQSWTKRWMQTFRTRGQLILAGNSISELKQGVDFAKQADIKQIYFYTQTWREGGFWPTVGNCAVNPAVFPRRMDDLKNFSDYCQQRGMSLAVHCVSLGIGFKDRRYMNPKPDRRMAVWCSGTLATHASADATELQFKPAPGSRFPVMIPPERTHAERERPGAMKTFFNIRYLRIGDEIIYVEDFQNTDKDVWILKQVKRGQHETRATSHPAGTDGQGLWSAYGQAFIPDNDSTLLDEMVDEYAGMVNLCRISQTEYDGAEDHCHEGNWGFGKLTSMIYARLEHPVMAHTSGGDAPLCHIEYRLNAVKRMMSGDDFAATGSYGLPYILDGQGGRPASSLLDAHFTMSLGAIAANGGIPNLGLQKPMPQDGEFGISAAMFRAHGLTPRFFDILKSWRAAASRLTPAQLEQMKQTFIPHVSGNHPGSALVHVLRKTTSGMEITPTKVLTRREGDILWHRQQELGTFGPKQSLRPGENLELENPFSPQPLQIILRVKPGEAPLVDPVLSIGSATISFTGTIQPGHYLTYSGGPSASTHDANWNQKDSLPAKPTAWLTPSGWFQIALSAANRSGPAVETQFITEDLQRSIRITR
jgi:hypothetical protein